MENGLEEGTRMEAGSWLLLSQCRSMRNGRSLGETGSWWTGGKRSGGALLHLPVLLEELLSSWWNRCSHWNRRDGEKKVCRGKVKNSFWTCQEYSLSGLCQEKFTDPWHKQCSQGKKIASEIYELVYGYGLLKIGSFHSIILLHSNIFGILHYNN